MSAYIPGIHHVTAISGPAQENVDFYVGTLGLRLVKKTVNFDDPGTYHLYYGNADAAPGSILTFFPRSGAPRGKWGRGQTSETSFAIPESALGYWVDRFTEQAVDHDAPATRFGTEALTFRDRDGLPLALVVEAGAGYGIRAFHGVSLASARPDETAGILTDVFGYAQTGEEDGRIRFEAPGTASARIVDIIHTDQRAFQGAGTVHHVAFRARSEEEQLNWMERIEDAGLHVTDVKDRQYFRSVYFREPGGILFEIATDQPGFALDEAPDELGQELKLPPWLESRRAELEGRLSELRLPTKSAP